MNNTKITKFVLMPAFVIALVSCGGNKTPTLKEISAKASTDKYIVGSSIEMKDFTVVAKYSDNTDKTINDYTVTPSLPYKFVDDDTVDGKDFNITYNDKACTVHVSVESDDGKSQIKFVNYDGTILQNTRVKKGVQIEYEGELPKKPVQNGADSNVFVGWDKEIGVAEKNTVFTAQFKQIDKYVDTDFDGIPDSIDTKVNDNKFDVVAKSFVNIDQNITIDFSKFLKDKANTEYDNDLAKLGLFMSHPNIEFKDGLFDYKNYGNREMALYNRLGFDDFKHFDFKDYAAENYKYDYKDTTSGVYGHKYLRDKDGVIKRDLIFIAFEGTNGPKRWASNFDVGYDDPDYYTKAAETSKGEVGTKADHPEWDDKNFHKGFYVAAHRVLNEKVMGKEGKELEGPVQLLKYIENHTTKGLGLPIVFVTGHSRGGAMANIVGEYLENKYKDQSENPKCIPFTYAFAAPSVYGSNNVPVCTTLFNILNEDDLVTKVPFSEWGFSKITGQQTISESAAKYKEKYDVGNERKYQFIPGSTTESIFHNLGCKGRDEIYKIDKESTCLYTSLIPVNSEPYTSQADANKGLVDLKKEYSEKLGDFFKFVDLKVYDDTVLSINPKFNVYAHASLGTITALVGCLMIKDEKVMNNLSYVIPLISNTKFLEMFGCIGAQIIDIIKDPFSIKVQSDKIALPHDYGAYHIILREYKEK